VGYQAVGSWDFTYPEGYGPPEAMDWLGVALQGHLFYYTLRPCP
jgi:hypothetical protein